MHVRNTLPAGMHAARALSLLLLWLHPRNAESQNATNATATAPAPDPPPSAPLNVSAAGPPPPPPPPPPDHTCNNTGAAASSPVAFDCWDTHYSLTPTPDVACATTKCTAEECCTVPRPYSCGDVDGNDVADDTYDCGSGSHALDSPATITCPSAPARQSCPGPEPEPEPEPEPAPEPSSYANMVQPWRSGTYGSFVAERPYPGCRHEMCCHHNSVREFSIFTGVAAALVLITMACARKRGPPERAKP